MAVEHAVRESRRLGSVHLGPEHMLLGLVREGTSSARLLEGVGCSPQEVSAFSSPSWARRLNPEGTSAAVHNLSL
jgi:hypothetical protein